jgi:hypothetical protein
MRVDIFDQIVERRIAEAMEQGQFDALPGAGRPLDLDDDPLVAPDLRTAYRILKNAGYVPDEVRLLTEIGSVEQLLRQAVAADDRAAYSARLRHLLGRLDVVRSTSLRTEAHYFDRLVERLGGQPSGTGPAERISPSSR